MTQSIGDLIPDVTLTVPVTIWKMGRTVCVYSMVQRKEKRRKTRDIYMRHQPLQQLPCIKSVTYLRHKYTCNSPVVCKIEWLLVGLLYWVIIGPHMPSSEAKIHKNLLNNFVKGNFHGHRWKVTTSPWLRVPDHNVLFNGINTYNVHFLVCNLAFVAGVG
jgi:hypothetical protein